ncbi:putative lipoprotein [Archangium gephyra]|uniref:Lipoprotein n=1 Tax=Archangium gephyra TaxID=48 RepID=A0AAC8Q6I1_9BACT|nr:putative lipoprotein [Archangium gephyra]
MLLGDGSKHRARLDNSGVVHFRDPAITGPQDVTLVMVRSTGTVQAKTYLALNGPEVRLPSSLYLLGALPFTRQGTVTGRVTGAANPSALSVTVVGNGLYGITTLSEDGSFSIDIRGEAPGKVDLFAKETEGTEGKVVRVGLKRDISVSAGTTVSGQDVALDHPVDQSLGVTVAGGELPDTTLNTSLRYILGGQVLFSTSASGTQPLSVPMIARMAPFDTLPPMLSVSSGEAAKLPGGQVQTEMPVGAGSSAQVTFLSPLSITSPAVGTLEAPASASRTGLVLRWSPDPSAHLTEVELGATIGPGPLDWSVVAPTSITSFTPFTLPADSAPVTTFPAGSYRVWATTSWQANASGYASFFTGSLSGGPYVETRTTRLLSYVELQ